MKYTTYLLGAGASFNAIPIYQNKENNFSSKFCEFIEDIVIKSIEFNSIKDRNDKSCIEYLNEMQDGILSHATVDTYARKLYLKNKSKTELLLLKILISFYLEYVQNYNEKTHKINIDTRYDVLFSNLLKRSQDKLLINDSIRILSWNYDNQLELGLKIFSDEIEGIDSIYKNFNIIPQNLSEIPENLDVKIVKLNGHAGFYVINDHNNSEITSFPNNLSKLDNLIGNLLNCLQTLFQPNFKVSFLINFAWETDNPYSKLAINSAQEILRSTDKLIIIGYSFPGYNHDVDSQILSYLNADSQILYQSNESNSLLARKRIKNAVNHMNLKNIEHTNYIDQFVLPSQFLSYFD